MDKEIEDLNQEFDNLINNIENIKDKVINYKKDVNKNEVNNDDTNNNGTNNNGELNNNYYNNNYNNNYIRYFNNYYKNNYNNNYKKYDNYENYNDEELFEKIMKKYDEKQIMELKNTIYRKELTKEDENKLLLRINKYNGKMYKYMKILEVNEDSDYIKVVALKSTKLKLIDSRKFFMFILKYNNFKEYLESFIK